MDKEKGCFYTEVGEFDLEILHATVKYRDSFGVLIP